MRARRLLAASAVSLCVALAGAGTAAAAPEPVTPPDRAAEPVPRPPTPRLAWVGRLVVRTVARTAPRRSARVVSRLDPHASLGPTDLLITRTVVRDGERWVEVLVAERPNGRRGWVRADHLQLRTTRVRVVIDLSERRLSVLRDGRVIMRAPVAVGKAATPTPVGRHFAIAERIRMADPRGFLGPFVLPLTGFSETLNEFAGGKGRVAIHGTSIPSLIGTRASHGCVRMRNRDIVRLSRLARPGTPVAIRR